MPLFVAAIGFASAVIGGLVQALTARTFEKYKFEQQAKWELYTQYFLVLGELSFSSLDSERHTNALSLMAQLRGRIGLIGSPAVVEAVGDVFRHSNLTEPGSQEAMVRAIRAMRRDVGKPDFALKSEQLVQLMFGSREREE